MGSYVPRTSRGLLPRAVLCVGFAVRIRGLHFMISALSMIGSQDGLRCMVQSEEGGCSVCAWRVVCVPGMGDDDVVERRMTLAEARETDLENHGVWSCCIVICGKGKCFVKGLSFAEIHLLPSLQKMGGLRDERTNAKNCRPGIKFHFTLASHSFHFHIAFHFTSLHLTSLNHMIDLEVS
jgi:hypothetical protein